MLSGRPAIAYSIEAARKSGLFLRVVVSTDEVDIARVAEQWGADVPFLRERRLADDQTPVSAATLDTLERLDPDGSIYSCVAQLMANCPLRTAANVVDSYHQFQQTGAASQISVTRYGWLNPWWAMSCSQSRRLAPLFPARACERSQDLPRLFCPTGAVWWIRSDVFRAQRTFHIDDRTGWELPWHEGVDIDNADDWRLAELLMKARQLGDACHEAA
jgi:N-acylneuraminate cytidylyltransferase